MRRLLLLAPLVLFTACAEPPSKEMNQAQGAIEAAIAAGAETYAPEELAAAVEALRRSEDAVAERDYRTALSHALDSRERATAAAKAAVSARARARGDVERQLAEASALLDEARERLGNSDVTRLPRRTLQDARNSLDAAETSLQEARTALNADDYAAATKAIESATGRIHKTNEGIDTALEKLPPRRRR